MHKGKMASKREMGVITQENLLPWTTPDTDEGRECSFPHVACYHFFPL